MHLVTECRCGCGMETGAEILSLYSKLKKRTGIHLDCKSGASCEEYNRHVGGSHTSQHMLGKAMDLNWGWLNLEDQVAIAGAATEITSIHGIGIYRSFLHIDCRESGKAFWVLDGGGTIANLVRERLDAWKKEGLYGIR